MKEKFGGISGIALFIAVIGGFVLGFVALSGNGIESNFLRGLIVVYVISNFIVLKKMSEE